MELKVLGCHGGETPKHRTSAFLLEGRLALDAGAITGTLTLEDQQKIETIVVSHAHMDHVSDLATIVDNRCQQGGPMLEIVGIPETIAALRKHFFNNVLWPDFSAIPSVSEPVIKFREVKAEETIEVASGFKVKPVMVSHTIDAAALLVTAPDGGTLAYSGDTGPTDRLWEVINEIEDLRALIMEVSFPNDKAWLAGQSGHHTPATLEEDLKKFTQDEDLPVLLFHIKPLYQQIVETELAKIKTRNLNVLQLDDQFLL